MVPGLDGRKMSKSYNNTIEIFDEPADHPQEGQADRHRQHARRSTQESRHCPLFGLFKLFAPPDELAEVERRYREGGIGYGEMKNPAGRGIIDRFARAREQRAEWAAHPERVAEVRAAAQPAPCYGPQSPRPRPAPPAGWIDSDSFGLIISILGP